MWSTASRCGGVTKKQPTPALGQAARGLGRSLPRAPSLDAATAPTRSSAPLTPRLGVHGRHDGPDRVRSPPPLGSRCGAAMRRPRRRRWCGVVPLRCRTSRRQSSRTTSAIDPLRGPTGKTSGVLARNLAVAVGAPASPGRGPAGEHGPVDGDVLVDHCCPVELSDGAVPDRLTVECAGGVDGADGAVEIVDEVPGC